MRLSVSEITAAVAGSCDSAGDTMVTGVTWDSREVKPGDLYVALPGERVDGHDFADAAAAAGAVAALVSRPVGADIAAIVVPDTSAALTELAAYWRTKLTGLVIGLTGSSGKTSTKNLVRDVLSHGASVVATAANQNNELGVPRTLLAADADTSAVVVEMGMRGMGQIEDLCKTAAPDWGLITNVGESHIELLGSRDNIAKAKAELFEALPDGSGVAFVNAADDYAAEVCRIGRLRERGVVPVFYDGYGAVDAAACGGPVGPDDAFVWATGISFDSEGRPSFTLNARNFDRVGKPGADGSIACALELRGAHSVSNACSAAAVGLAKGMTLSQCAEALAAAQPERGRQQIARTASGVTVVDDSYNANPDSMKASLSTFAQMEVEGRRIAVLGDMLELGDFSRECHERVGAYAAEAGLDHLICVGELSSFIAQQAVRCGLDESAITRCASAEEALEALKPMLSAGDAVLAKASHSIGLDRVVEGLVI